MNQKLTAYMAKLWATDQHAKTNHLYNGEPYSVHLTMVSEFAHMYINLIEPSHQETVLAACWAHDTIEDCRVTYNDVKEALGEEVAEIVYALTNEKGKNRKERANGKYYAGIAASPLATFVKVCDRIANFEYSLSSGSKMAQKYAEENREFVTKLFMVKYADMFAHLTKLETKAKQLK